MTAGAAVALALAGCSSGQTDPSEDSNFLQEVVVPRIERWAHSSDDRLALFEILAPRSFDTICAIPDYNRLAAIEAEVGHISSYHGSRGSQVPEGSIALVAIKGRTAHVTYINGPVILFGETRRCHPASTAVVSRAPPRPNVKHSYTPRAILGE